LTFGIALALGSLIASDMEEEQRAMPDLDSALDDDVGDEMLRLVFTACHPCFRVKLVQLSHDA
jgi:predicted RNA polymerase sigma factor